MSLVGSIFTPDGIVIAGDSLSTISGSVKIRGEQKLTCKKCGDNQTLESEIDCSGMPLSTRPFSQKIFPFFDRYGVGTVGAGQLQSKTIYFHLRQLERGLKNKKNLTLDDVADLIGKYLHDELKKDLP